MFSKAAPYNMTFELSLSCRTSPTKTIHFWKPNLTVLRLSPIRDSSIAHWLTLDDSPHLRCSLHDWLTILLSEQVQSIVSKFCQLFHNGYKITSIPYSATSTDFTIVSDEQCSGDMFVSV